MMIKTLLTAILLFSVSISQAEVISITDPSYEVPNTPSGVLRPTAGMTMQAVKQQFGIAEYETTAIGKPPITVWKYPNFEVYFEYNIVIHSVVPQ